MYTSKKTTYLILASCLILFVTLVAHNIVGILHNCFHATDFGIYQQAIYEIAQFGNLNPFLTIRNINIFNDHFDPVIFLAVPFVWIFQYHAISLILFELFVLAFFLYLVWKYNPHKEYFAPILFMLLTTKAILSGILYPIHPSTWSMVPLFLIGLALARKNNHLLILSVIGLCLFREAFPLAIIFMSLSFLIQRDHKTFASILSIGVFFTILVYFLRPLLLGPTVNYGGAILTGLMTDPLNTLKHIDPVPALKIFYPFVIPFYFLIKDQGKRLFLHPLFAFWLPLIGLHFLNSKVHAQYGPFLIVPLWAILIFHPVFIQFLKNKKALIITMILFAASSSGTYTKSIKLAFFGESKKCEISPQKREATKEILASLKNMKEGKTIIATGGVVPTIMKPGMRIYQAGLFSQRLNNYDYLLLERNNSGDLYPFNPTDIENTIKNCSYKTIIKNDHYFLAEGPIPYSCLTPLWEVWP